MMEMVMGAKVNGKLLHVAAEKGKKASKSEPVEPKLADTGAVTDTPALETGKPANK
jgi:hypothetical protein